MKKQMSETAIREETRSFLVEFAGLPKDELTNETSLFLSGRLSSADAVDLFIFIESAFGMQTDMINIDLAEWDTVAMITDKVLSE